MTRPTAHRHHEPHVLSRVGWLRAAVLGANDGIVSTASLMVGVASAGASSGQILLAGVAGTVAGAMSMAAGEYVSVSSQADAERAELAREARELREEPDAEHAELAGIYRERGLDPTLAGKVADALMAHDALAAHARDELGLTEFSTARPLVAAGASALTFAAGASLPVVMAVLTPNNFAVGTISGAALVALATLGALGGVAGGAGMLRPALRVLVWGAAAMAATAAIGSLFGVAA